MPPTGKTSGSRRSGKSLIKLFWAIDALLPFEAFLAPVMVVYYLDYVDLTFEIFSLYTGLLLIYQACLEVPLGTVSDRVGRRQAFVLGQAISVAGLSIIALAPSLTALYVAGPMFGAGMALKSGNLGSIAYEAFQRQDAGDEYQPGLTRYATISTASMAIAALIGGFVAIKGLALPMLIDIGVGAAKVGLSFVLLILLWPSDEREERPRRLLPSRAELREVAGIMRLPQVLQSIAFAVCTISLTRIGLNFYQPVFVDLDADLDDLGYIFAFGILFASGVSYLGKNTALFRMSLKQGIMAFCAVSLLAGIAFYNPINSFYLAVGGFVLHQFIRIFIGPVLSATFHGAIPTGHHYRTTIISMMLFIQSVCLGGAMALFGYIPNYLDDLSLTFTALHLTVTLGMLLILWASPK